VSNFLLKNPHCVHIHIAKTGGSSIRLGIWPGRPTDPEVGRERGYTGPIQGHIPEEWVGYFKFAFVRHPMDRFFSAWRDFKQMRDYRGTIEDFAREAMDPYGDHVSYATVKHHTYPQTHPDHCLQHADFVGRYENYHEDLIKILDHVGMVWTDPFPLHRATTEDPCEISEKTRRGLEEYYERDFYELEYSPR